MDEPFYVMVRLRNTGAQEARILRYFEPGTHFVSFEIAAPGEGPQPYRPWVEGSFSPEGLAKGVVRLPPGQSYSGVVDLTYDGARGLVLSWPGEYRIEARYAIREDLPAGPVDVRSNELRVVVREPQGVDRGAYEVLQKGARTHDRGLWNAYGEQKACYERVLGEFPGSRYAPYVRFYLAQVHESAGDSAFTGLRGTAKGAAAIRRAAMLYQAVAEKAGGTAFGREATRFAARTFAKVGEIRTAQALLEEAFVSPQATHQERLEVLSSLGHLESGLFHHESGLAPEMRTTRLRLPLRRFAEAMGLSVAWDPKTQGMRISGPMVQAGLKPGEHPMYISGGFRTEVTVSVENGRTMVSRSVIAALMAAQQGRDASRMF